MCQVDTVGPLSKAKTQIKNSLKLKVYIVHCCSDKNDSIKQLPNTRLYMAQQRKTLLISTTKNPQAIPQDQKIIYIESIPASNPE